MSCATQNLRDYLICYDYGEMHEYSASLKIVSDKGSTAEISERLRIQPTHVVEVGDRLKTAIATKAVWNFEAKTPAGRKWTSLEDALIALLAVFSDRHAEIREIQLDCHVCLWCGHFSSSFDGGPVFSPTLLRMLGDFGVEMFLDTYFSDDSE